MEPDKIGQRRRGGQRKLERELALALGAEFGLGTLEGVSAARQVHKYLVLGMLAAVVAVPALAAPIGVAEGPYGVTAKVVTDLVVAALFAVSGLLLAAGWARTAVSARLYRYSGGLAQLVGDEPEPRVARWIDVRDIEVEYYEPEDLPPRLNGFALTTVDGTRLPGIRGQSHRRELRALVAEAERQLAPRLVPAMTQAYEAGAAVSFGRAEVSQEGITLLPAWRPPGELVPWSQVKSIHLTYIDPRSGDYVNEVIIGRKGQPTGEILVEHLTNGIFLPALLSHAAKDHGVLVTGYHADGGGITGG